MPCVRGMLWAQCHGLDLPDGLPSLHCHHDSPRVLTHSVQEGGHVPEKSRG